MVDLVARDRERERERDRVVRSETELPVVRVEVRIVTPLAADTP